MLVPSWEVWVWPSEALWVFWVIGEKLSRERIKSFCETQYRYANAIETRFMNSKMNRRNFEMLSVEYLEGRFKSLHQHYFRFTKKKRLKSTLWCERTSSISFYSKDPFFLFCVICRDTKEIHSRLYFIYLPMFLFAWSLELSFWHCLFWYCSKLAGKWTWCHL